MPLQKPRCVMHDDFESDEPAEIMQGSEEREDEVSDLIEDDSDDMRRQHRHHRGRRTRSGREQ